MMEPYFRKVSGLRPGEMRFPDPVPTIQYDAPIGPMRPTFRERLESEAPFLRTAADRFTTFAQNHPINHEPRERIERNTRHERGESSAQERREHQGRQPFTVGSGNFGMSDFLPPGMGSGLSFDEMAYGHEPQRKRQRRKKR